MPGMIAFRRELVRAEGEKSRNRFSTCVPL